MSMPTNMDDNVVAAAEGAGDDQNDRVEERCLLPKGEASSPPTHPQRGHDDEDEDEDDDKVQEKRQQDHKIDALSLSSSSSEEVVVVKGEEDEATTASIPAYAPLSDDDDDDDDPDTFWLDETYLFPNSKKLQESWTPLHSAIAKRQMITIDGQGLLFDPNLALAKDMYGFTPLHKRLFQHDFYLKYNIMNKNTNGYKGKNGNPSSERDDDNDNEVDVDVDDVFSEDFSEDAFRILLSVCPDAAAVPTIRGYYPLHTACQFLHYISHPIPSVGHNEFLYETLHDGILAETIHIRFTCDSCNSHGIRGTRYKCTNRQCCINNSFDLCEKCYFNNHRLHHPHVFECIYRGNLSYSSSTTVTQTLDQPRIQPPAPTSTNSCNTMQLQKLQQRQQLEGPRQLMQLQIETIRALLDVFPEAVGIPTTDTNSNTPLHIAMQEQAPLGVIRVLLNHNVSPEMAMMALETQNEFGETPLMVGIQSMAPTESLLEVLNRCPISASIKDRKQGTWVEDYSTMTEQTSDVVEWVNEEDSLLWNHWNGNIAMHTAIRKRCYPTSFLLELLRVYPNVTKVRDGDGQLPLHVALCDPQCDPELVDELIKAFPAATKCADSRGYPLLHMAFEYAANARAVELVLLSSPDTAKAMNRVRKVENTTTMVKWYGRAILPIHAAMCYGTAEPKIVKTLLDLHPNGAIQPNEDNEYPFHMGLQTLSEIVASNDSNGQRKEFMVESLLHLLDAYPAVAKKRDLDGQLPLFQLCKALSQSKTEGKSSIHLLRALFNAYPGAAEKISSFGATPIDIVVKECIKAPVLQELFQKRSLEKLKILIQGMHDGRALRSLCGIHTFRPGKDAVLRLSISYETMTRFFYIFDVGDCIVQRGEGATPMMDLNREAFPGWTLLEMLADFDTADASSVLLQIVRDQRSALKKSNAAIQITIASRTTKFVSIQPVSDATLMHVADRAKLSKNSSELKQWGQVFGRFLRRYRVENSPKHVSETCVVVFATEPIEEANGRVKEMPVALKFMTNRDAFCREISKRAHTKSEFILPVKAFFTEDESIDTSYDHVEEPFFGIKIEQELEVFPHLSFAKHSHDKQMRHILVMERGGGSDLHDIINHRNIAGRDLLSVLAIAKDVACCLQFLNERCGVIHGDVKARNFVALEAGMIGFAAIDLDNAASTKENEIAARKKTSSGYVPPEQASIEHFCSSKTDVDSSPSKSLDEIETQLQKALAAKDPAEVSRLYLLMSETATEAIDQPHDVVATPQYDMWCFGCLLYYLCTGVQLFNIDVREDAVDITELAKIKDWHDDVKSAKLQKVGPKWPRQLLGRLLEKDPRFRPKTWQSVIDDLSQQSVGHGQSLHAESRAPTQLNGSIFISYARVDWDAFVVKLVERLRREKFTVWVDQHLLHGGNDWMDSINAALENCATLILVMSPEALRSKFVKMEYRYFYINNKRLIPILYREADSVPAELSTLQHIDFTGAETAAADKAGNDQAASSSNIEESYKKLCDILANDSVSL